MVRNKGNLLTMLLLQLIHSLKKQESYKTHFLIP